MPSDVVGILERLGAQQAQQRAGQGEMWGQLISGLGQIPGQIQANRYAQLLQQQQQEERELRMQMERNQMQLQGLQIAGKQREAATESALDRIWGSGVFKDDGSVDVEKAGEIANQNKMGHLIPHIREQASKWNESAMKLEEARLKTQEAQLHLETTHRDYLGINAATLDPNDIGTFQTFVSKKAKDGSIDPDIANRLLQTVQTPNQIKEQYDQWMAQSPTIQGQKSKAAERAYKETETKKLVAELEGTLPPTWAQRETARHQREQEAIERVKAAADSPKNQDKLEQEARQLVAREFSSRSGGMGLEDQKVNQAIHLLALDKQFQGKNMPAQMYAELALGLARLTAPTGTVGIELEREFHQKTAAEGISKAIAYLTGDPTLVNATPQALRDVLRDSIMRQGLVAERNRETYFKSIQGAFPTRLEPKRKEALVKAMKLNNVSDWEQVQSGSSIAGSAPIKLQWNKDKTALVPVP